MNLQIVDEFSVGTFCECDVREENPDPLWLPGVQAMVAEADLDGGRVGAEPLVALAELSALS